MLFSPDWERKLKENIGEMEEQVKWADVIVCQYINSPEGLSVVQAMRDLKPTFAEVDDYFKQVPYQSIAYDENKPGDGQDLWATRQMMESKGVIVSTPWLVDKYKEYNPNIKCIPNCIDFDLWDSFDRIPHDLIRIGWIGGATHEGDLKLIKAVLYDLINTLPNIEVYIVSAPPPNWPKTERMHLVEKWVLMDEYTKHVKTLSFDIGLAPLRDNLFNRGKSNLRGLEYSACKIPTVASPVEPFKNGLPFWLANDDQEWYDQINLLATNEDVRKEAGILVYNEVKEKYNLETVARQYAQFLTEQI